VLKTYDQLVGDGSIFKWPEDGEAIASAARFNQNVQACIDLVIALETQAGVEMTGLRTGLAQLQAGWQAARDADDTRDQSRQAALDSALGRVVQVEAALAALNETYQTDSAAAATIAAVNQAWCDADGHLRDTLNALIADRPTFANLAAGLNRCADKTTTYSKTEMDRSLLEKANAAHTHSTNDIKEAVKGAVKGMRWRDF